MPQISKSHYPDLLSNLLHIRIDKLKFAMMSTVDDMFRRRRPWVTVLQSPNTHYLNGNERWTLMAEPMLTARERDFHRLLLSAYPEHLVFAQVALSQLIAVKPGAFNSEFIRSRYKQLVADFVLCRPDYGIVAVIEVDDLSHLRPDRQDADRRKSTALQSAGLPLVRIPAGPLPNIAELGDLIRRAPQEAVADVRPAAYSPVFRRRTSRRSISGLQLLFGALAVICVLLSIPQCSETRRRATAHTQPAATPLASPIPSAKSAVDPPTGAQPATPNQGKSKHSVVTDEDVLALQNRKETAWRAYYTPPTSCTNPSTHSEIVECGNLYLSARRKFEAQWKTQQSSNR